jgi:cation diffusion facilitator CzcD-associated flavoprotein CzcO
MLNAAPKKYHYILLPSYSAGCKRRILDPDFIYLKSLHSSKMTVTKTPLTQITKDAVIDANGTRYPADVIVLANGFLIGGHIAKINVTGRNGLSLLKYWEQKEAVSSYRSVLISEFPNFFMIDGPNSASGHFSVIYSVECQVAYTCKLVWFDYVSADIACADNS